ncbi:hypothetical protein IX321_001680 [Bacteroides pyogenes]|nr:hypothetical protein [Bacteroides pyogenes]MBR8717674.1 hypothetical protein [Bacteroides pyogenes]MBR8747175.1 hypothetical protein [Bacteroides pyogenes]MBR8757519.1 hypothetical protein [Bacteroides pyogenes]MBR8780745.1 hypothetical protein [Bacteroides pyogenes]
MSSGNLKITPINISVKKKKILLLFTKEVSNFGTLKKLFTIVGL